MPKGGKPTLQSSVPKLLQGYVKGGVIIYYYMGEKALMVYKGITVLVQGIRHSGLLVICDL